MKTAENSALAMRPRTSSSRPMRLFATLTACLLAIAAFVAVESPPAEAQANVTFTMVVPTEPVPSEQNFQVRIEMESDAPISELQASFVFTNVQVLELVGVAYGEGWQDATWVRSEGITKSEAIDDAKSKGSLRVGAKLEGGVPAGKSVPFIVTLKPRPFVDAESLRLPFRFNVNRLVDTSGEFGRATNLRNIFVEVLAGVVATPTPAATPTPRPAVGDISIELADPGRTLEAGDEFDVNVRHQLDRDINAIQFDFVFDPAVAQVSFVEWSEVWQGGLFFHGGGGTLAQAIATANTTGNLRALAAVKVGDRIEPGEYLDATITMEAVGGGEMKLALERVETRDLVDNSVIPMSVGGATITVAGPALAATATPDASGTPAGPAPTAVVRDAVVDFEPDEVWAKINNAGQLKLFADVSVPFRSVTGTLNFNSIESELESVTTGDSWSGGVVKFGDGDITADKAVEAANDSGELSFEFSVDEAGQVEAGRVELMTLNIKAPKMGQFEVIPAGVQVRDIDDRRIPVTSTGGTLSVSETGEPTDDFSVAGQEQTGQASGVRFDFGSGGFPWIGVLGALAVALVSGIGAIYAFKGGATR